MRAAVFTGVGQPLSVQETMRPTAGPGQMLLGVRRCGVCGTDLHLTEPGSRVPPGVVLGHEFCGEVMALGPGVEADWKLGDRVVSMPFIGCGQCAACLLGRPVQCRQMQSHAGGRISGGFGEVTPIAAAGTVRLPDAVSWDDAALIEPLAVGLHGVRRAGLDSGANVLVVGAGPVALAVIICAKALGARRVIVTARSARGAEMALALGADDFLEQDADVKGAFRRATGGPPDAVFECVGAPGLLQQCVSYAPFGGKVVVLGGCMKPDTFTPAAAMNKELDVIFSLAYELRDFQVAVDFVARRLVDASAMITDRVGLDDFPEAFEALRQRTHQCKVLLSFGG